MSRRSTRRHVAVIATALIAGSVTACSSSSGGGGGGGTPPGAKAATAALTRYAATPTSINISVPLTRAPARGKSLFFIGNSTVDGLRVASGIKAAAKAAGWKVTVLNYDVNNFATGASLIKQAVQAEPDFIAYLTLPQSVVGPGVAQAKAAGIPVFSVVSPDSPSAAAWRFSNPGGSPNFVIGAKIDADYIVSEATATSKILFVNVPSISELHDYAGAFHKEITARCPECSIQDLNVQYADVTGGSVPAKAVAFLRAHPDYKFVNFGVGVFSTGFASAARSAGLKLGAGSNDIKVSEYSPSAGNLTDVKNGNEQLGIGLALPWAGWMVLDAMMRYDQHMSLAPNWAAPVPVFLFTPKSTTSTALFDGPKGYEQKFATLWRLASA